MKRRLFDESHEHFGQTVGRIASDWSRRSAADGPDRLPLDAELWHAAGESGLLGLHIPAEYGGSDAGDYRFAAIAIENLAPHGVAVASCLSVHFDVVVPYFVNFGNEPQKEEWLPRLSSGAVIAGIAMTEPSAGSDLTAMKTRARQSEGGWLISGDKTFITNGASAGVFIVAAQVTMPDGADRITLFIVPGDSPGLTRGAPLAKVGLPEADTCELRLDDVHVGTDALLGELGGGFGLMRQQLAQERIGAAIACVSHARHVLSLTADYVRSRPAFGGHLADLQNTRFTIARLSADVAIVGAYVDACVEAHTNGDMSASDAAIAKWRASEIQNEVADSGLQLHGGYGYMREYEIARSWMDARVTRIWAGANEVMAEIVARDALNDQ